MFPLRATCQNSGREIVRYFHWVQCAHLTSLNDIVGGFVKDHVNCKIIAEICSISLLLWMSILNSHNTAPGPLNFIKYNETVFEWYLKVTLNIVDFHITLVPREIISMQWNSLLIQKIVIKTFDSWFPHLFKSSLYQVIIRMFR